LFSAETTAHCIDFGISAILTFWRLTAPPVATISLPSSQ
jgi:hypothetical protein